MRLAAVVVLEALGLNPLSELPSPPPSFADAVDETRLFLTGAAVAVSAALPEIAVRMPSYRSAGPLAR